MLATGQINAAEAEELLRALDSRPAQARPQKEPAIARSLRITIDPHEGTDRKAVTVTVPLALAKFAGGLIPAQVRERLDGEGLDIAGLLERLDRDLPAGPLVDLDSEGGTGPGARIVVEVV